MASLPPHSTDQPPANRRPVVLGTSLWPGRLRGLLILGVALCIGHKMVHDRSPAAWMEFPWYFTLPVGAVLLSTFIGGYRDIFRRHSLMIDPGRGRWILKAGVFPFFRRGEGNVEEIGGVVLRRDTIQRDDATVEVFVVEIQWRRAESQVFRVQEFDVEVWRSGSFRLRSRGESNLPAARARAMEVARLAGLPLHDEVAYEEIRPAQSPEFQFTPSVEGAIPNVETEEPVLPYDPAKHTGHAYQAEMVVPGASVLRLLRMRFLGYSVTALFVALPILGPRFRNSDHPPIDLDSAMRIGAIAFSIATVVLICRHVPTAASTLIRIQNGRFQGRRRWLLLSFRRREYSLDFVGRVRVDRDRIEVEFAPPRETCIYASAGPIPRFWYFAHGLPAEEQEAIATRLRCMVAAALAAPSQIKSLDVRLITSRRSYP